MDEEGLNILKELYINPGYRRRLDVKAKYGIDKIKPLERKLISQLIKDYIEIKQRLLTALI